MVFFERFACWVKISMDDILKYVFLIKKKVLKFLANCLYLNEMSKPISWENDKKKLYQFVLWRISPKTGKV